MGAGESKGDYDSSAASTGQWSPDVITDQQAAGSSSAKGGAQARSPDDPFLQDPEGEQVALPLLSLFVSHAHTSQQEGRAFPSASGNPMLPIWRTFRLP